MINIHTNNRYNRLLSLVKFIINRKETNGHLILSNKYQRVHSSRTNFFFILREYVRMKKRINSTYFLTISSHINGLLRTKKNQYDNI